MVTRAISSSPVTHPAVTAPPSVVVLSGVGPSPLPALACVLEFEKVIAQAFDATVVRLEFGERPNASMKADTFVIALSFPHLSQMLRKVGKQLPQGRSIAYVFDAFLSPRFARLPWFARRLTSQQRQLHSLDHIFTPMRELVSVHSNILEREVSYIPIGVDALRFGSGDSRDRWVDVNGYGRQPPELTGRLSNTLNAERNGFFYHTDHFNVGLLRDPDRHRAMFWQLLRKSKVALAYAPEAFDPHNRFECSFVGQRWFESLAAGCIVAGKRPRAAEAAELLSWPDATIELPDDYDAAARLVAALAADTGRLAELSRRNHLETLRRHDWRLRLEEICTKAAPHLVPAARAEAERVRQAIEASVATA